MPKETPKILLVELPEGQFWEYLEIFKAGKLGRVTPPKDISEMLDWRNNAGFKFFKVVCDQDLQAAKKWEVVGACAMNVYGRTAFFSNWYVKPEFRGQGFGKALRLAQENLARSNGAKYATANFHWRNVRQMVAMAKEGYRPRAAWPSIFRNKVFLRFRKPL